MTGSDVQLVLASGSPRRRELLEQAGWRLRIESAPCDETWRPPESPTAYAARVAADKAKASLAHFGGGQDPALLLAADTTVWIPGQDAPLGKPATRDAALAMLTSLFDAGQHRVSTAFCLLDRASKRVVHEQCVTTKVSMRRPSPAQVQRYLDTREWSDKAGGYGIQGAAAGFVTDLEGSYTNVVGLPLAQVLTALAKLG